MHSMQEIEAAVAVISAGEEQDFLLLRRATDPNDPWSGHWAFPGGRRDVADNSLLATSIRECDEECGLNLFGIEPTTELPPAWAGRAVGKPILVAVYHWHLSEKPGLALDGTEMVSATWMPRSEFQNMDLHQQKKLSTDHPNKEFPYFELEGHPLWGFSYNVLKSFILSAE
ncbi:MAG: NUDIX domain-containing protein [Planctomycetes bacterium]|nr:NUDIX domain-containing protein [Planctomycetota bacterium]